MQETERTIDETSNRSAEIDVPADSERRARVATVQAFLNCYLREVGEYSISEVSTDGTTREAIRCDLDGQQTTVWVPLSYQSPVGRPRFDLPAYYRPSGGERRPADYTRLLGLLVADLADRRERPGRPDELLLRTLSSCRRIERYVRERAGDQFDPTNFTFCEAEQSLVFGHPMHPTPKSRQGIPPHQEPIYAPELGGSFPLHYFRAAHEVVESGSALDRDAPACVKSMLREDPTVSSEFVADHVESDDVLIPVHPWQADYLCAQSDVRALLDSGDLVDLGPVGREFYPTSSVRTLYAPDAEFMVKGSLNVKITNSVRTNKREELARALAVADLFDTALGGDFFDRYPRCAVVHDPAYLTVETDDGEESGFEVLLRENPFVGDASRNVAPVVALCQDDRSGGTTRVGRLIETIADREGRTTQAVARDWFERYLDVVVEPVAWLYLVHGVAMEAHQQNAVVALDDGYPARYFQRDNQGYYVPESMADHLRGYLPDLGDRFGTVYPDEVADDRLRYQLFVNNVLGVVNALGAAGVVDECDLLDLLEGRTESLRAFEADHTALVSALLDRETIPRKGNLLTRFHDLDEMAEELNDQTVYTDVRNPLVRSALEGR